MFTSKQYRDKAAEYKQLTDTAITLNEKREYQNLEQRFTTLADNEQWMVDHREQIVHAQTDCRTCWARYLCSGGCHQETRARTDAGCDFIRAWLDFCLASYCELSSARPEHFHQPFLGAA